MSWKRVCATSEINGNAMKKFEVDGVAVMVANLGDGYIAFPTMCPHMEEPLEDSGVYHEDVLTCTKHLWQWNIRSGEKMGMAEVPLRTYETKQEGDEIFIFFEKEITYDYEEDEDSGE
jgi:toluene monooxygenase system ferredoxin subunit